MYHPSILHHLNQTYPSDNESTSDGVGGTAGRMTFNSIARGMQQGNDGALLSRIQQNAGSLRARDEELYSESSSEESEDEYGDDDDSCQYQSHLNHDGNDNNNHSNAASEKTKPIDAVGIAITDKSTNSNAPPTPWAKSKAKQGIIDALKDEASDIHLSIGPYSEKDYSKVNFKQISQAYTNNRYKMTNFRTNLKLLLKHHLNKSGPFAAEKVEPWHTSATNVSRAYSLLFMLYMNPAKYAKISRMTPEEIWESHPQFQLYELNKFKTYNKNMKELTLRRRSLVSDEEANYKRDMLKYPKRDKTSKGIPFWPHSQASELLIKHVIDEMEGNVQKVKPAQLWKSRTEYQAFPLLIFRKHIYQERTKKLAAPYWQHKRNKIAHRKYEETEAMLKEWDSVQWDRQVDGLIEDWDNMNA